MPYFALIVQGDEKKKKKIPLGARHDQKIKKTAPTFPSARENPLTNSDLGKTLRARKSIARPM